MTLKIGDIVSRKSYGSDILFKVVDIKREGGNKIAVLNGLCFRLEADAPETDLVIRNEEYVRNYNEKMERTINLKIQNLNSVKELKKNSIITIGQEIKRSLQSLVKSFI